jgi:hypothetical protein
MTDLWHLPAAASTPGPTGSPSEPVRHPSEHVRDRSSWVGPFGSVQENVRRLELSGLAPSEAGNVVATMYGLRPADSGWTALEIERMRFLRALVLDDLLES